MSRPAVVELLAALAAALRRGRRRWYVFGAQAAAVYGRPRLTADVDVTVEADDAAALLRELERAGFRVRIRGFEDSVDDARVLPLVHGSTAMPVDVVLAGPGLEEEFLARAKPVVVAGVKVPVISPEDLLVTKILAGRRKDLDDVLGVLIERLPELDLDRVRAVLGALESALGQSDLLPSFAALVDDARANRTPPAPRTRRGQAKKQRTR